MLDVDVLLLVSALLKEGVPQLLEEAVLLQLPVVVGRLLTVLVLGEHVLLVLGELKLLGLGELVLLLVLGTPVLAALLIPLNVPELEVKPVMGSELRLSFVADRLPVADAELDGDNVMLKEDEVVCVGDALRRLAMLRPRTVMEERVASASPASHSVEYSTPLETRLLGMSCEIIA